ncbi:unnamed protein product [Arctogadus glacialis]
MYPGGPKCQTDRSALRLTCLDAFSVHCVNPPPPLGVSAAPGKRGGNRGGGPEDSLAWAPSTPVTLITTPQKKKKKKKKKKKRKKKKSTRDTKGVGMARADLSTHGRHKGTVGRLLAP